jgi:hypothetical protein
VGFRGEPLPDPQGGCAAQAKLTLPLLGGDERCFDVIAVLSPGCWWLFGGCTAVRSNITSYSRRTPPTRCHHEGEGVKNRMES